MFLNLVTLLTFIIILFLNFKNRLNNLNLFEKSLIIIVLAIGLSRVFSPQFWIWIGGLSSFVVIFKQTKLLKLIGVLSISALFTQILYPALYVGLLSGEIIPSLVQIIRIGLFIYAMILSFKLLINSFKMKVTNV